MPRKGSSKKLKWLSRWWGLFQMGLLTVGLLLLVLLVKTGIDWFSDAVVGDCTKNVLSGSSIQAAVNQLTPGDILCIGPGTYNEHVRITRSGLAGKPITIRGLDPKNPPVITGKYNLPDGGQMCWANESCRPAGEPMCYNANYDGLVDINNQSFITISNLKIVESRGHFIQVSTNAHDVMIANVVGDGARRGSVNIQNDAYNVTVRDSDFRDTGNYYRGTRTTECLNWPVSLMIVNGAHDIAILNNKVHETWGEGISVGRSAHDVLIEGNQVYDNMAVGIYVVRGYNVDIFRNHVYWTGTNPKLAPNDGIGSMNETKAGEQGHPASHHINVVNNFVAGRNRALYSVTQGTFKDASSSILFANNTVVNAHNAATFVDDEPQQVRFVNNVILQDPRIGKFASVGNGSRVTYDHNLWSATLGEIPGYARGIGDQYVPDFALVGGNKNTFTSAEYAVSSNFRVLSDSLALDKGVKITDVKDNVTRTLNKNDFFAVVRPFPQAGGYDLGAYEFCGSNCNSDQVPTSTVTLTLTPTLTTTPTPTRVLIVTLTPTPTRLPTPTRIPTVTLTPTFVPTQTPRPTLTPMPTVSLLNLVKNPGFEEFAVYWRARQDNEEAVFNAVPAGYEGTYAGRLKIAPTFNRTQVFQILDLQRNQKYRLEFMAKASRQIKANVSLHQHAAPYQDYGLSQTIDVDTTWRKYSFTILTPGSVLETARLRWDVGNQSIATNLDLDAVVLRRL